MNKRFLKKLTLAMLLVLVTVVCTMLVACNALAHVVSIEASYSGRVIVGGSVDDIDITVTAHYNNGTDVDVTENCVIGELDTSSYGDKTVDVSYTDGDGVTQSTQLTVTVEKPAVVSIDAVYTGGDLFVGQSLERSSLVVTAHYEDNTVKVVENYNIAGAPFDTAGEKDVVITFTDGNTVQTTVKVSVKMPAVTGAEVQFVGGKKYVGDELQNSDFRISAKLENGGSRVVEDFSITPKVLAEAGQQTVTISFDTLTGGAPYQTTIEIEVLPVVLTKIEAEYTGQKVLLGEQPDVKLLVVTAFYSNGSSKVVNNFTTGHFDSTSVGVKTWEISFTDNNVTESFYVEIAVVDGTVADMSIHFMELGNKSNGDSIYIKAGDTDILIDAGSTGGSAATIKQYVDKYCTDGVLEYVIATHADEDHIAAFNGTTKAVGILDAYECENIIKFARTGKNTNVLNNFLTRCENKKNSGTNVFTALECYNNENGAQRVYELAEGITMEILYQKFYETDTSNENDYSVCIMFTQGDNHYLFLGDLEEAGEKSLVENNPDLPHMQLYKAGHHGSPTSANEVLLSKITPEYVCVSCVAGSTEYTQALPNTFPSQTFIDRIAPYTDKVYVTTQCTLKQSSSGRWSVDQAMSMNGNIVFSCIDGVIEIHGSNNDTKLKDTQWFKDNRTLPAAWAN